MYIETETSRPVISKQHHEMLREIAKRQRRRIQPTLELLIEKEFKADKEAS